MSDTACEQSRELVLHHDLEVEEREAMLAALRHVEQCAECRRALEQFDKVRGALGDEENVTEVEPEGGWEQFEERMTVRRAGWIGPRWYALAAMVLLVVAGAWMYGWQHGGGTNNGPMAAELTASDVGGPLKAFREVSSVFDGRAGWLVLSGNDGDIGLAGEVVAGADRPVVTRLLLLSGGRAVSSTDVVIALGQSAKATVAIPGGKSVEYVIGTHADRPGRLDLGAEISGGGSVLASMVTQMDINGARMVSVGRIATAYGDYEIRVGLIQGQKTGKAL